MSDEAVADKTGKRYATGHLNLRDSVMFSLGAPGWQITATIIVSIGIYYYLPPEGAGLVTQVSEEIFFGVLTAYGVARLAGGAIDSLADPIIGHLSDRSRAKIGRRKLFLILGTGPMVLTPVLLFFPPYEPGSQEIFVFLTVLLCLYYIFFTVYTAPYNALIPELARTEAERVELARIKSIVSGCIAMTYGILWLAGIKFFRELGFDANSAVQIVVVLSCIVSFVFCICPILAIKEEELDFAPSSLNMMGALSVTFFLGLAHIPYGFLTPSTPDSPHDLMNLVIVFSLSAIKGLGIAGLMILPTVLLGQLIDLDEARTQSGRAAMYYGVQGLMTKWVYAASAAAMSYLLSAYGRSADEPFGVLLVGPVAGVSCLIAAALYLLYPEKEVRAEAERLANR